MEKEKFVIDDDALSAVTGGAGMVSKYGTCEHFVCCFCYQKKTNPQETEHICKPNGDYVMPSTCEYCEHSVPSLGNEWACNL